MLLNDSDSFISKRELKEKGLYSISFRRKLVKNIIWFILFSMSVLLLIPLFSIVFTFLNQGLPVILKNFPSYFVTRTKGDPTALIYGLQNAAWGSILVLIISSIISIPLGIEIGIYLAGSSEGKFVYLIRLMADVLQSIPSIIAGVVIYEFFILPRGTHGFGYIAGGMAMSILMTPIIARTTEEGIRTVPSSMYEAAMALGLPEWRIMLNIVVNSARPVIMTGIFLAVARIMGETAPLIVTAGDNDFFVQNGFTPLATLTMKIYTYAITGYRQSWIPNAYGMALVLMVFILIMSILMRTDLIQRFLKHLTFKILIYFSILLFFIISVRFLFDNTVFFVVASIILQYQIFNILTEENVFYRIWKNLFGRFTVTILILLDILELLFYYLGKDIIIIKYLSIYNIGLIETEVFFTAVLIYYVNKNIRKSLTDLDKVRIFLLASIGLLLIRMFIYSFFYTFFYEFYITFALFMVLKFIVFKIYKKDKTFDQIWNESNGKWLVLILSIETLIESIIFYLGSINKYLFFFDLGLSVVFLVFIYFYYASKFIKKQYNLSLQNLLGKFFIGMYLILFILLTFNGINGFIVLVFLTAVIFRFIWWFIFVKEKIVYSLWSNMFGKILFYLESLEIIIQTLLLFTKSTAQIVYQINFPLVYILGTILIVYFIIRYIIDLKTLANRERIFVLLFFLLCILDLADPSLILINVGLTYKLASTLFGQISFGLLLKSVIILLLISTKIFDSIWHSIVGKIIMGLGALETIAEFLILILALAPNNGLTFIMILNGLMIYFIVFYYLIVIVFKFDIFNKILVRNVN